MIFRVELDDMVSIESEDMQRRATKSGRMWLAIKDSHERLLRDLKECRNLLHTLGCTEAARYMGTSISRAEELT